MGTEKSEKDTSKTPRNSLGNDPGDLAYRILHFHRNLKRALAKKGIDFPYEKQYHHESHKKIGVPTFFCCKYVGEDTPDFKQYTYNIPLENDPASYDSGMTEPAKRAAEEIARRFIRSESLCFHLYQQSDEEDIVIDDIL